MLKNKALFGAAALVVFVAGLVAGKSKTKAAAAASLYYKNSGVCTLITSFAAPVNAFTTGGTGTQATIRTAGGSVTAVPLFATAACSAAGAVHFHL